jgi:hypothetical protein
MHLFYMVMLDFWGILFSRIENKDFRLDVYRNISVFNYRNSRCSGSLGYDMSMCSKG